MLLYNITVSIDNDTHEEWIGWVKTTIAPLIMQTGYFVGYEIWKVLLAEETDNTTYAVQFRCTSPKLLNEYVQKVAPKFQAMLDEKYKNKYVIFRTLLEEVK